MLLEVIAAVIGIMLGVVVGPRWANYSIRRRTERASKRQIKSDVRRLAGLDEPTRELTQLLERVSSLLDRETPSFSTEISNSGLPWILAVFVFGGITLIPAPLVLPEGVPVSFPNALLVYMPSFLTLFFASAAACYFERGRQFVAGNMPMAIGLPSTKIPEVRQMLRNSFSESGTAITAGLEKQINDLKREHSDLAQEKKRSSRILAAAAKRKDEVNAGLEKAKHEERAAKAKVARRTAQRDQLVKTVGLLTGFAQDFSLILHRRVEPDKDELIRQLRKASKKLVEVFGGEQSSRCVLYAISEHDSLAYPMAPHPAASGGAEFECQPIDITEPKIRSVLRTCELAAWTKADFPAFDENDWSNVMLIPIPYMKGSDQTMAIGPSALLRVDSKASQVEDVMKGTIGYTQARALATSINTVFFVSNMSQEERFRIAKDASMAAGALT